MLGETHSFQWVLTKKTPKHFKQNTTSTTDPTKRITAQQALAHHYFEMDPLPSEKYVCVSFLWCIYICVCASMMCAFCASVFRKCVWVFSWCSGVCFFTETFRVCLLSDLMWYYQCIEHWYQYYELSWTSCKSEVMTALLRRAERHVNERRSTGKNATTPPTI